MINNTVFREKNLSNHGKQSNDYLWFYIYYTLKHEYLESKSRQDSDPPKVYKDIDLGIV